MTSCPFASGALVATPSEAARALNAVARERAEARHLSEATKRAEMTERLRNCVAAGRIAHMEWKA